MKILILILSSIALGIGQGKLDYIWLLGGNRNPTMDTSFQGFQIDFNNNQRRIYVKDRPDQIMRLNNASICDKDGKLLLYTSGCWISDRSNKPLPNGIINQGAGHDFACDKGDYNIPNGSLILPKPNQEDHYFIIHKFWDFVNDSLSVTASTKLLYSEVDMNLNNGFGDVTSKNQTVIDKYLSGSDLTAVRHANNNDWWIVNPGRVNNKYYVVQMTEFGALPFQEQIIGLNLDPFEDGGTQSCFSPDGTKYARLTPSDGLFLMKFDRNTGELSNFINVKTGSETAEHSVGVAFSPDSRFVYLSYRFDLYQVDTWEQDLQASLIHIDSWDGYVDEGLWAAGFDAALLGPDCKIYIRTGTSNKVMHVIHEPNKKGKACNFQQHGIRLPAWNNASIPNFVNYRLGYEPVCDGSLVMAWNYDGQNRIHSILIYPNPVSFKLNISTGSVGERIESIRILDIASKILIYKNFDKPNDSEIIDVEALTDGVYFCKVQTTSGKISYQKFIKSK